jgi:hypothetical protein
MLSLLGEDSSDVEAPSTDPPRPASAEGASPLEEVEEGSSSDVEFVPERKINIVAEPS